jgi:ppGpp synthetase/RelA/SpoT-type nucleotidyltranferase
MPREPDPFKPPPGLSFTKGQVNRAGRLISDYFSNPSEDPEDPFLGHDPDELVRAMFAITWWKGRHARPLSRVAAGLRYHVIQEDGAVEGRIDVAQRLKKRDTIIGKLHRYPRMELTQMHDIGGVRATLPSLAALNAVSRRLKKTWTIKKTRDYISAPKPSGYRAVHHDVLRDGVVIEVQLRTVRQHAWANQVEDDGRRLGIGYKFGFGSEQAQDYYRVMGEAFHVLDRGEELPEGLRGELRSSYAKIQAILRPDDPRSQS